MHWCDYPLDVLNCVFVHLVVVDQNEVSLAAEIVLREVLEKRVDWDEADAVRGHARRDADEADENEQEHVDYPENEVECCVECVVRCVVP